jgi:cellulose synthase operon protein C
MRRPVAAVALALFLASGTLDAQPAAAPSAPSGPLGEALKALEASDYAKAESALAAIKGAQEPDAKLLLARAALEQGKHADAEKHATTAAASAAHKVKAAVMRAEIMLAQGKRADVITLLGPYKATGKGTEYRKARLLLGEALIDSGKRDDADEPLKKVIEEYNDGTVDKDPEGLAHVARAAYLLRSPKDANTAFKDSEKLDKKRVETKLWWSELFLDKYDPGHAEEVTKEGLELAPKRADLLVRMARVKLDQTLDFEDAEKLVKEALGINPKHTGAFAVRAGLALRDMDIANADKAVSEGLAVNPNDLELLSLKAAIRFLDDDMKGFEQAKKEVFAKNPQYSRFYGIVGEFAEWEHRYDDIVAMMKEATKVDPDDGKAWAELGLTQMRSGEEDKGFESIKKAWSKDKFNVRVFNTLNMYEQDIPNSYETLADGVFKVRYAKDERPVMERYVPRMLGEAWGSMKARYGFVPKVPVQVELYNSRQTFSVRTSGLPNIGIQGVCFGGVVAAISPKAEPANWGNVLWHELGHVFHIQLSKNHVPRWFTEGLAEYETIARRSEWARELDPELYQAIVKNKLPGAVDMNRAFTHANDASEVTVAYYAASQMMVWTVERFGMQRVVQALKLWGEGKKTPDVLKGAFGVSPQEYDQGFRQWALGRLARYKNQYIFNLKGNEVDQAKKAVADKPNDATAHVELAISYLRARKAPEAKKELEAALAIDAKNPDAHFVSARLAMGEKDRARAEKHLDTMRANGHDGFAVRMLLADLAEAKDDIEAQRLHLESAWRLDPSQSEPLKGLYDLAKKHKKDGDQLDILKKLAPLEQHDRQVWRLLMEKLIEAKQWDEARRLGEGAIFVDVMGGQTHALYARALAAQNAHDKAVYEYETALTAGFKEKKDQATTHALLAQSLVALKRNADATKHRDEAVKLDPDNAEAKAIKLP